MQNLLHKENGKSHLIVPNSAYSIFLHSGDADN